MDGWGTYRVNTNIARPFRMQPRTAVPGSTPPFIIRLYLLSDTEMAWLWIRVLRITLLWFGIKRTRHVTDITFTSHVRVGHVEIV
jgi:hypothetical protein